MQITGFYITRMDGEADKDKDKDIGNWVLDRITDCTDVGDSDYLFTVTLL